MFFLCSLYTVVVDGLSLTRCQVSLFSVFRMWSFPLDSRPWKMKWCIMSLISPEYIIIISITSLISHVVVQRIFGHLSWKVTKVLWFGSFRTRISSVRHKSAKSLNSHKRSIPFLSVAQKGGSNLYHNNKKVTINFNKYRQHQMHGSWICWSFLFCLVA